MSGVQSCSSDLRIKALRDTGVPYPEHYEEGAFEDLAVQAQAVAQNLRQGRLDVDAHKEIIALIAYLQRLGTDIRTDLPAVGGP